VLRYEKRLRQYAERMSGKPYTADDETRTMPSLRWLSCARNPRRSQAGLPSGPRWRLSGARIAAEDGKLPAWS